ncbi:hypothetical protein ACWD4P_09160 [Kitasatospora sp. NPDC002543]
MGFGIAVALGLIRTCAFALKRERAGRGTGFARPGYRQAFFP